MKFNQPLDAENLIGFGLLFRWRTADNKLLTIFKVYNLNWGLEAEYPLVKDSDFYFRDFEDDFKTYFLTANDESMEEDILNHFRGQSAVTNDDDEWKYRIV